MNMRCAKVNSLRGIVTETITKNTHEPALATGARALTRRSQDSEAGGRATVKYKALYVRCTRTFYFLSKLSLCISRN